MDYSIRVRDLVGNKHQVYYDADDFQKIVRKLSSKRLVVYDDDQEEMLICAKAYFFSQHYQECLDLVKRLKLDYSNKILYERQALYIKAAYLNKVKNLQKIIQIIVEDFHRYKNKHPGRKILKHHEQQIQMLKNVAVINKQNKLETQEQKQRFAKEMGPLSNIAKLQGMPCFLFSKKWNSQLVQFLFHKGQYPGPITNFELLNHIFQFHRHIPKKLKYMDTLMFPYQERAYGERLYYYSTNSQHWNYLYEIFGGTTIQRMSIGNDNRMKPENVDDGDTLVKTAIQFREQIFIFQWQKTYFWQRSVFPVLTNLLHEGQLKKQTVNQQYLVVQPGKIQDEIICNFKYVQIHDHEKIIANTPAQTKRKSKIITGFDLEEYHMKDSCSFGKVGLQNLGNSCYMNSAIQCLSQISDFTKFFTTNQYLSKLVLSDNNKHGSFGMVACGFADILKRLWFCSSKTRYINPIPFKRIFGQRYIDFRGYQQQDAQQFLMYLLNCIHEDLNEKSDVKLSRNSISNKNQQQVKNEALSYHTKHNKSIITSMFTGFHSEIITCEVCKNTIYRFEDSVMFHIQVPPQSPTIQLFFLPHQQKPTNPYKLEFIIEEFQKFGEIINAIEQQFKIPKDSQLYGYVLDEDWQLKTELNHSENIKKIIDNYTRKRKQMYIVVYETKKLFKDEQLALVTFHYQGRYSYTNTSYPDGYPRLISIKTEFLDKKKQDELKEYIADHASHNLFTTMSSKSRYYSKITKKNLKGSQYSVLLSVKTNERLKQFKFYPYKNILGKKVKDVQITLTSCLTKMSEEEIISQDQGWFCGKCQDFREAKKSDRIYKTGKILMFDFKRFTERGKIKTKIQYPVKDFDMTPFIQDRSQRVIYNLIGVVLHRGSLDYGHYTSICWNQKEQKWYYFDDQQLQEIDQKEIVNQDAYILFYKKK